MKFLTLNTHSLLEENQNKKLYQLAENIFEENYDIIALQEVNQPKDNTYIKNPLNYQKNNQKLSIKQDNYALELVSLLKNKYNLDYYWSWAYNHQSYNKYDEGVALLSKYPLEKLELYPFSETSDPNDYHTRVALGATISIQNQKIKVYSIHASWWKSPEGIITFPNEAKKLNKLNDQNHLTFLLGDFNNPFERQNEGYDLITKTWYDTYQLATLTDGKYTMGGQIAGWDATNEALRIDFIFVNQKIKIKQANIFFDGRKFKPISDHYAYSITL